MIEWLNELFENNSALQVGLSGFVIFLGSLFIGKKVANKYINKGHHRGDVVFGDKKGS